MSIGFNKVIGSGITVDDTVMVDGRHLMLDAFEDGTWWASDKYGEEYEFFPGSEEHHEPSLEGEA